MASVVSAARNFVSLQAKEPFGHIYRPANNRYDWGSNQLILQNLIVVSAGYDLTGELPFLNGVREGMDYIFGRNAMNMSYVTGYGSVFAKNQHSRWYAHQVDSTLPNPPVGTLAGGPNSTLVDDVAGASQGLRTADLLHRRHHGLGHERNDDQLERAAGLYRVFPGGCAMNGQTGIAFIGTGFVADYYMTTLANHPQLRLVGVWDIDRDRLKQFCNYWNVRSYASEAESLSDPAVTIIVNLTTPESHYAVNRAALMAGKHVYCEKPLAMSADEARELVALSADRDLILAGAPANALSDACGHCADILKSGVIGTPRLAYAEMEDGPVFHDKWQEWRSRSGAKWPAVHEFEIGCTLEHAGYAASWLISLFGPVSNVAAFSALTFPNKGPGTENLVLGPDFSVGCLTFKSGFVARLTSGLAAPWDRSLTVVGDKGTIVVRDLWDNRSPIHVELSGARRPFLHRLIERLSGSFSGNSHFASPPVSQWLIRTRRRRTFCRPIRRKLILFAGLQRRQMRSKPARGRFFPERRRCI
ncbi:glycoside hydrolase family 9 protein [Rhizobium sp. RCAM05350]|nr:glycoside hydrolase family 9 protein [Rhizobium sp. RCAM05350]